MMIRGQRLGLAGVVVAASLLLVVGVGSAWAEETIDPVGPTVEPETGGAVPVQDDGSETDAGVGGVVLDPDSQLAGAGARPGEAGSGAALPSQMDAGGPGTASGEAAALPGKAEGESDESGLVAEFALTPMSAKPGGQVRFSGKCLLHGHPGDRASVGAYWANEAEDMELQKAFSLRTEKINDDGTFDQLLTIPLDATPGLYDVPEPICGLQDQIWNSNEDPQRDLGTFTVLGADTPGGGGDTGAGDPAVQRLAETGGSASLVLLWGAVVAGFLGVGLLARARYAARRARA